MHILHNVIIFFSWFVHITIIEISWNVIILAKDIIPHEKDSLVKVTSIEKKKKLYNHHSLCLNDVVVLYLFKELMVSEHDK